MEARFWNGGADSARQMAASGAVFVVPYPCGILEGDALWRERLVGQRWRSVVMGERHVTRTGEVAVLADRVSAERAGEPIREAVCISTYLRDDARWLRLTHQETLAQ